VSSAIPEVQNPITEPSRNAVLNAPVQPAGPGAHAARVVSALE